MKADATNSLTTIIAGFAFTMVAVREVVVRGMTVKMVVALAVAELVVEVQVWAGWFPRLP